MKNNPEIKKMDLAYEFNDEPGDITRYEWIFNYRKVGSAEYIVVINKQRFRPEGLIHLNLKDCKRWIEELPKEIFKADNYGTYRKIISKHCINKTILHLSTCYGGGMNVWTAFSMIRCLKKYLEIIEK